jgi:predicted DNA-binding transcriptional regulator AlpA
MSITRDLPTAPMHDANKQGDRLLTPKEAAKFLRVSESFLAKARMRGDGPRYRKLSRAVRYSMSDLLAWLKTCAKTSTAE